MIDVVLGFLDNNNKVMLDKNLIRKIGLQESLMYSVLLNMYAINDENNKLEHDSFSCTYEQLEEETGLIIPTIEYSINKLIDLGLIYANLTLDEREIIININKDINVLFNIMKKEDFYFI